MAIEGRLVIVEDDRMLLDQLQWSLKGKFEIQSAGNAVDARKLLDGDGDLYLLDLRLPPSNEPAEGLGLLAEIRQKRPEAAVVVMTGESDRHFALKAIELGAYDFFRKPFDPAELSLVLGRALEHQRILSENRAMKNEAVNRDSFGTIVGSSKAMQSLFRSIEKVAPSDATVLIYGESGTGKELVAQAIHRASTRCAGPFIAVNSSALPETLAESELFGHERGAFTGATSGQPGKFELAHQGTLFLDEVATLSAAVQAKLLRVLENRKFERVGGSRTISVNIRFIAATNEELTRRVAGGTFREDLLYRLNTVTLKIPPLREREGDLPLLLNCFAERFAKQYRRTPKTFSPEAGEILSRYRWPGNIREMEHLVEMLTLMVDDEIVRAEHLPGSMNGAASHLATPTITPGPEANLSLPDAVSKFERRMITDAIAKAGGVKARAARALGIDANQLKYLCRKYQL